MDLHIARNRAELPQKATNILDSRTLAASHKRLAELIIEGMTVLDVGCGTGAITHGIAKAVGAKGQAVGVDSNTALIEKARQVYGGISNVSFEIGDIYKLPYKNKFDIVTSARVLQWLANPLQALDKMKDAAKVGGRIVILDYNHEKIAWNHEPPASMKSFYSAFLRWRSDAGMNNAIADCLPDMFKQAGIDEVTVTAQHEITKPTDADYQSRIYIWAEVAASRGIQMVKDGFITENERAAAEKDFRTWINEVSPSQTMYLLAVEGIKK